MIYLFSQMAISLVLAAIVGGALGWLVHRARAEKQIRTLKQIVGQQQQHVSEAQTEVSILAGDFDDLKQRAETQISELQLENHKIPALNQNLEKSQLLVRQLMQKHKAELSELADEKEKLLTISKQANLREKDFTKLQAELDIERRKSRQSDVSTEPSESQSELALDDATDLKAATNASPKQSSDLATDEHKQEATAQATPETKPGPQVTKLPLSGNSVGAANTNGAALPSTAETETELKALRDHLSVEVPQVTPERPHKIAETDVDDAQLEQLFDTVEQHDDLKQIFGIGPVTEKTLNKLGITAYSQLAELKQHDIDKIADALQIFPGRIERDNWVGGARTQLEEVLEDL